MVTRDTLKQSANLPFFGAVSIGSIILVGAVFFFLGTRRKKEVRIRV